jgi:transcriptional regulator with XRE-family HTH domain
MVGSRSPRRGRQTVRRLEAQRAADEIVRRLAVASRSARKRRGMTQAQLGERVGISQSEVSRIELGGGHAVPMATWVALADAVGLRPRFDLARDWLEQPADAGHLAIQELLLRLARTTGSNGQFELPIRPNDPARSIDVFIRDDHRRRLIVAEAWNTFGDVGAGARSFDRKLAAARELAVAIGNGKPYDVHGVWVVRATARNRELIGRYQEVFAGRFPGSSSRWVRTLMFGEPPPAESGLIWSDVSATRIFAWRRPPQAVREPAERVDPRRSRLDSSRLMAETVRIASFSAMTPAEHMKRFAGAIGARTGAPCEPRS